MKLIKGVQEKKILKHLFQFTIIQLFLGAIFVFSGASSGLNLIPTEERIPVDSFWFFIVIPAYLFLEELIFRVSIDGVLRLFERVARKIPNRVILFLAVATIFDAYLHTHNILSGGFFAVLGYFLIHISSGFYLAWIYAMKGLFASWFVHVVFDLLMIFLGMIT